MNKMQSIFWIIYTTTSRIRTNTNGTHDSKTGVVSCLIPIYSDDLQFKQSTDPGMLRP